MRTAAQAFRLQQSGRRICCDCGNPIKRLDKWYIGVDGRVRHSDCKKPAGKPVEQTMELGL